MGRCGPCVSVERLSPQQAVNEPMRRGAEKAVIRRDPNENRVGFRARVPKRRSKGKPPRGQLREIGQKRGDKIAEVQRVGPHELADRVLRRRESPNKALADIATDLAGVAGVIRERGRICFSA